MFTVPGGEAEPRTPRNRKQSKDDKMPRDRKATSSEKRGGKTKPTTGRGESTRGETGKASGK